MKNVHTTQPSNQDILTAILNIDERVNILDQKLNNHVEESKKMHQDMIQELKDNNVRLSKLEFELSKHASESRKNHHLILSSVNQYATEMEQRSSHSEVTTYRLLLSLKEKGLFSSKDVEELTAMETVL